MTSDVGERFLALAPYHATVNKCSDCLYDFINNYYHYEGARCRHPKGCC